MASSLRLRIVLLDPPPGVRFAVQSGKSELLPPARVSPDAITFEVSVRLGAPRADGGPSLMPPIAQGPAHDRFIYVNSGTLAGEPGSPWTRRAKIKTAGIGDTLVQAALASPDALIEARIAGTGRGGGPPAGTVPLVGEWRIASALAGNA